MAKNPNRAMLTLRALRTPQNPNPSPNLNRSSFLPLALSKNLSTSIAMISSERSPARPPPPASPPTEAPPLYRRLSALGFDKGSSVAKVMNGWLREGNVVKKYEILRIVRELRKYKRHQHALELLDWMEKRGTNLSYTDYAIRLDLISKTKGIEAAEEYFTSLSKFAQNQLTYGALFNCYCKEKMPEKALPLFEKMKELKIVATITYNNILTLYMRLDQPEMVPTLVEDMKTAGVSPDTFTYNVLMKSYASLNDIDAVERVVEECKAKGGNICDWTSYSNLSAIYVAAGQFEKAGMALKECEKVIDFRDRMSFHFLISLYACISKSADVKRIWKTLKSSFPMTTNLSYLVMLQALARLDDTEGMMECFEEWESVCSSYDFRLPNVPISFYARRGMVEEAEALLEKSVSKGGEPNIKTLEVLIEGYLKTGKVESALKCLEHAIYMSTESEWQPNIKKVRDFCKQFEEQKDIDAAEKFCELLKKVKCLDSEVYDSLLRTYIAAGKIEPLMRQRIREDAIEISPETEELLQKVCP